MCMLEKIYCFCHNALIFSNSQTLWEITFLALLPVFCYITSVVGLTFIDLCMENYRFIGMNAIFICPSVLSPFISPTVDKVGILPVFVFATR